MKSLFRKNDAASEPDGDDETHRAGLSLVQLNNSQTSIRDTTKWLVAAAAAVAGVVVAGLQLSSLPAGFVATAIALAGFVIALLGVALVIFSAASVLSVGFTTLGQIAGELVDRDAKRKEREFDWESRVMRGIRFASWWPARSIIQLVLKTYRAMAVRMDWEGINVGELVEYVDSDVIVFSNGLAGDVAELYFRLRETDAEILALRGETLSSHSPSSELRVEKLSAQERDQRLAEVEWRANSLETASGTVIAFANQKIIERKFDRLKWAVRAGGMAVLVGVGMFAVAPKLAQPKSLAVEMPTAIMIAVKDPAKFGPRCRALQLDGVAIGGMWKEPIVVTEPSGTSCLATRLTLKSRIGIAVPILGSRDSG